MKAIFSNVLKIVNGRNQKNVENPNGIYPIYGSGGVIGYANDYICEEQTVVIGRKGSINNPIFVSEKFWNVDTAFGLVANSNILLPKYLYYFCKNYDFSRLSTTVTIPSLTKANLLDIEIEIPSLEEQSKIVDILDKIQNIISIQRSRIDLTTLLIKSQFIEMFGDPVTNPMGWEVADLEGLASVASGVTKGRKITNQKLFKVPYMRVANVKDGYIDMSDVKYFEATEAEVSQYRLENGDILMTEGGDPDKVGRGAIWNYDMEYCIHQNHIFRVRFNEQHVKPIYFAEYLKQQKTKQYFLRCAKQTTGIASINMTQLKKLPVMLPPIELQNQFATFVEQADKSKFMSMYTSKRSSCHAPNIHYH